MAKQKVKRNNTWILIGVSIFILFLSLFAVFSPSKLNSNTQINEKQQTKRNNNNFNNNNNNNNNIRQQGEEEEEDFQGDFNNISPDNLPTLPTMTKDGKPIDPNLLKYAYDLEAAMKKYADEVEGSGLDFITSGNKLSQVYLNAGFYKEAAQVAQQTLSVVETEFSSYSFEAILPLKILIQSTSELGMFRESVEYLTFLESITTDLYGATDESTIDVVMNLLGVYIQTGNLDNANIKSKYYTKLLEAEYNNLKSEFNTLVNTSSTETSSKEIYEKIKRLSDILNSLSDMYFVCSTVWDRIEADPDGSANLRVIRTNEDSVKNQVKQEVAEVEETEESETLDDYSDGSEEKLVERNKENDENQNQNEENEENEEYKDFLKPSYSSFEIYREQEFYRREVIFYREEIVNLITQFKQLIIDEQNKNSNQQKNPYLIKGQSVDSRAKLAFGIQQYAYLRYQHNFLDSDTVKLFHQLVNISIEIAESANTKYSSNKLLPLDKDVAISLNNLGSLYLDLMKYDQAEQYVKLSLQLRQELLTQLQTNSKNNNNNNNNNNKGKRNSNESIQQAEIDLAMCKGNLGRVYFHQSDWINGEREIKEGLDILQRYIQGTSKNEKQSIEEYISRLQFQLEQGKEMKLIKEREDTKDEFENEENEENKEKE